ncbi:CDP-alcohol phosphatidyltransferase [Rubripirellula lacrimiformis]|uniref:CDP-diacylglycerol--serine O-phosphatidyltransferase n=2 Tax=Rubripirellula lacrimiformis TaxID=1930273 RepID=A0A517N9V6_9BACT|nr:CDP-alcohol phosphatidyltransferase [Rubripirellula lacrimiformis]
MSEMKRGLHPRPNSPQNDDDDLDEGQNEDGSMDSQENSGELPIELTSDGTRLSKRRRRRRLTLAVLPTLLTLGNGVCGLAAIAVAMSENLAWSNEKQLLVAGVLIFGGMLFDALDGSAARMTGQESRFGAELDSLCDAITFGTAPAVLVWRYNDIQALPLKLTWAIGVLFALCVLIRLARFNVETGDEDSHEGFEGLPSPAAAGTLAAFAIAMPELAGYAVPGNYPQQIQHIAEWTMTASHYVLPGLALILAYLMVSRFQYPHVFQQLLRGRRAPNQIGQALFVVIGALVLHWLALPIVFCYYAFGSPIRTILVRYRSRQTKPATPI